MGDALSQKIRTAREEAGLTREQLLRKLNLAITLRTLARWESGETTRISVESLSEIARATGQPLSYFLTGDEVAA